MGIKKVSNKLIKIFNITSYVLFGIVMAILVLFLIFGFSAMRGNKLPSFFGNSYIRVAKSMETSGFNEGEVAIIENVKLSEIKTGELGDKNASIIAYYFSDDQEVYTKDTLSLTANNKTKDFTTGKKDFDEKIIFHQVIGVYYDGQGNTWFETQGTSNDYIDGYFVRGDYVIGQYKESGAAGFIQFMSSTGAMIGLILVPSLLLIGLLVFDILQVVAEIKDEKKALAVENKNEEEKDLTVVEEKTVEANNTKNKLEKEGVVPQEKPTIEDKQEDIKDNVEQEVKEEKKSSKPRTKLTKKTTEGSSSKTIKTTSTKNTITKSSTAKKTSKSKE